METGKLQNIEPKNVFAFFEEICNIPHGSGNISEISDYLVRFAKERKLAYFQDLHKNVIIIKEASKGYEQKDPIIIQGHMDMVTVKQPDSKIDFIKDGLDIAVENDFIYAKGTSLGGDDGIAVAYGLALLDGKEFCHPRLEFVITVDEEIGMNGARDIDLSMLKGKRLINIDSEEEGFLLAGCAGGATVTALFPITRNKIKGLEIEIGVGGLLGGHSGVEIDKQRGNANYLLTRIMRMVNKSISFSLVHINGGTKDNAIPCDAIANVILDPDIADKFIRIATECGEIVRRELMIKDPSFKLRIKKIGIATKEGIKNDDMHALLDLFLILPDGVQAMSGAIKGLVETSLNLGIVETQKDDLKLVFSVRSSMASSKEELLAKLNCIINCFQGSQKISGSYPAWEYALHSPLRENMVELYEKMYKKPMEIMAIHAGLECGLFSEKIEGLDCVSIGPDMNAIHTTAEKLSISSTRRVWEFLLAFLKQV